MNFSIDMKTRMVRKYNRGKNIYTCHGQASAFSKDFIKKIRWPAIIGEDAYSYLLCRKLGFEYVYQDDAAVFFSPPQFLKENLKRSVRFIQSRKEQKVSFPDLAEAEYRIPFILFYKNSGKYFFKNPFFFTIYVSVYLTSAVIAAFKKPSTVKWIPAASTKTLISNDE